MPRQISDRMGVATSSGNPEGGGACASGPRHPRTVRCSPLNDPYGHLSVGRAGLLNVGAVPSISTTILVSSVSKFLAERSMAKVNIHACQAPVVIQDVAHHRLDLA